MMTFAEILQNFFTHKDFLPSPEQIPGTLFSPLQIVFCGILLIFIIFACIRCAKMDESRMKRIFCVLWLIMLVSEPVISLWEACSGKAFQWEWDNMLPFWPCSIFLFAAPFAIWGRGYVREAACGYICTLGLLGGTVNFVYPATYLSHYSCISFAGFRTIFYHGSLVFVAVTMLLSGYHSFSGAKKWWQLLLPAAPALIISIPANIANAILGTDYMFFKMESFFFAPIGAATPDWFSMILVYIIYLVIHGIPYLPAYLANGKESKKKSENISKVPL